MPNVNDRINVDNYKFGGLMKKLVLYILMIALLIAGCGGEKQSASNKLQVAASFCPIGYEGVDFYLVTTNIASELCHGVKASCNL